MPEQAEGAWPSVLLALLPLLLLPALGLLWWRFRQRRVMQVVVLVGTFVFVFGLPAFLREVNEP